jgi:hypothetical protein
VNRRDEQFNAGGAGAAVPYLPLTPDDGLAGNGANGDRSIGALVRDASAQVSTLVRAEVELAKSEVVREVKRGVTGSIFFIIAAVVALYSSFFFFFFLGELLSEWLDRWAAFGIVFVLMLLFAGLCGLLGWLKVRKIRAPQKTISSVKETAAALRPKPSEEPGPAVAPYGERDLTAR